MEYRQTLGGIRELEPSRRVPTIRRRRIEFNNRLQPTALGAIVKRRG
jgi:hypothetical protein